MAKNLWKLDRSARGDTRADGNTPSQAADDNYQTVGATLRSRREERGEDLRYVAQMLRIRYPYLKAIEDGRPDELPGPTYAVGFVRTYADHLGLDSDKLVQRFKAEAAGLQSRADLHFPAPLPESKIPSGAVLVVAVLLAAFVYGAWVYLSSGEKQVAEIVPQLPNRISEIIRGKPAATVTSPPTVNIDPAPSAAPEPVPETTTAVPVPPPPSASMDSGAGGPAPSAAVTEPQAAPDASYAPESPPPAVVDRPGAEAPEVAPSASMEADSEVPPAPSESLADQLATRGDPSQTETAQDAATESEGLPPKVYGMENGESRIVIHAAADSWVEVRDSRTDELLLTRVLFKGDSYRVPDRAGLTLLTGNAGGLRIAVDGQDTPTLGPLGAVRRNVVLEPGPLKSGTADGDGASGRLESRPSDSLPSQPAQ